MRVFLSLLLLFIFSFSYSQTDRIELVRMSGGVDPLGINGLTDYSNLVGNPNEWSKTMGIFYQFDDIRLERRGLDGSVLLYDNIETPGLVYVKDKVYKMENINYNIKNDQFFTKIENDSIFLYTFVNIDKISIKNRDFEEIYNPNENKKSVFEILHKGKKISLLKKHTVKFIAGSDNPMVNRPRSEFKKKSRYFIKQGEKMTKIKLKKSNILNLLDKNSRKKAANFIKDQKLSIKKEKDLKQLINYCNTL